MARKKKLITLKQIRKIAQLQPTYAEAAAHFEISVTGFKKLLKRDPRAQAAWESGLESGKLNLRRKQHRLASVNATMGIHLGKTYLGQNEKTITEITGADGGPVAFTETAGLNAQERAELRKTLERARERIRSLPPD